MKRFIYTSLILLASLVSITSCKDPVNKPTDEPVQARNCNLARAQWFGSINGENTSNFYLQFTEEDINLDDLAEGEGWLLVLDINCDGEMPTLAEGTYECSSSPKASAFTAGSENGQDINGSYIRYIVGGYYEGDALAINNGTVTITKSGNAYTCVYKGTIDGKAYEFHYSGAMEIENEAYPREPMTTTTANVNATTAVAKFVGTSSYSTVGEYTMTLSGDYNIMLGLYSTETATAAEIPAGTYTTDVTEGDAFSLAKGFYKMNTRYPTIVFTQSQNAYYYIRSGKATISKTGDDYTVEFEGTSACGSKFTFHYTGAVTIK